MIWNIETTTGKIRKTLEYTGIHNYFLKNISIIQGTRVRIDKWDSN
jgi:hypothetical protein